MNRNEKLKKALLEIMSESEVNYFISYLLSQDEMEFIKNAINDALRNVPLKAFNCASLSALLGAIIIDNSNIPAAVIAGHLDYLDKRIFYCKGPIPYSDEKEVINEIWDGHCWVELNNLIIDISIFRTVYYGNVPKSFHHKIKKEYGEGRGAIAAYPDELKKEGFNYIPCYCLTQDQINGLIKGLKASN
jgi:hypothetical protein